MRDSGQDPQVALTTPILTGLDGHDKMSKSLGNHIGVSMDPFEMYSKVMSLPDANMKEWYTLLTSLPIDEIERLCTKVHPKSAKDRLGKEIVNGYHPGQADEAAAEWEKKFSKGEVVDPQDLSVGASTGIIDLVVLTKLYGSKTQAKQVIEQGGVEIDGARITDLKAVIQVKDGMILKVGKKKNYYKLKVT
jgi:tyrosyl-tRNA synthetase